MSYVVRDLLDCPHTDMRVMAGKGGLDREIITPELNRPSLELTGHFSAQFRFHRIQVLGTGEINYIGKMLQENPDLIRKNLETIFSYDLPCVIITGDQEPPRELLDVGDANSIPIMVSSNDSTHLYRRLVEYLEQEYAPRMNLHGVLVEVFGIGILLLGSNGVGKSECALDLVTRGHSLVADDLVEIRCLSGAVLMGHAIQDSHRLVMSHYMEIRGLGIINVPQMFGDKSVHLQRQIDLAILLEDWDDSKRYDRTGLDLECHELLGVKLPKLTLPVKPGRNVAMLVEVAAIQQNQKRMRKSAAEVLAKHQLDMLQSSNQLGR